jgi:hypothetical protein
MTVASRISDGLWPIPMPANASLKSVVGYWSMKAGDLTCRIGNGPSFESIGSVSAGQDGVITNGSSGYIRLPKFSFYSMHAWETAMPWSLGFNVRTSTANNLMILGPLGEQYVGTGSGSAMAMWHNAFSVTRQNGAGGYQVGLPSLQDGNAHRVDICFDGTNCRIAYDGVVQNYVDMAGFLWLCFGDPQHLQFGWGGVAEFWDITMHSMHSHASNNFTPAPQRMNNYYPNIAGRRIST